MRQFREAGYDHVSMRAIAEKIEYSPALIYRYFENKDDIFFTLHEEGFTIFITYLERSKQIKDPLERLKSMGRDYLTFAIEHPAHYELMFINNAPLRQSSEEWPSAHRAFGILHQTVSECLGNGGIDYANPDVAAISVWSYMHGISALMIRCRLKMLPEEHREEIIWGTLDFFNKTIMKP